jgi:hypothetical protein
MLAGLFGTARRASKASRPAWILKRLGMKRRTTFVAPATPWLHKILGWALWLEGCLLPKGVYGTSLLCECRPEARKG